MDLKERGIYQLPNGRELVAIVNNKNRAVLYSLSASESGQYESNSEGRLVFNGKLTAWDVDHLLETGRVASPELIATLVDVSTSQRDTAHEQST
jgi:hypothetical protein